MQQFHDQVGLPDRGAAGDRGADAGGYVRVQEIHVQADMQQAVGRPYPVDEGPRQPGETDLVHRTHVMNVDIVVQHQVMLGLVDGADAHHGDIARVDRVFQRRAVDFRAVDAAEHGDGHAVGMA